SSITGELVAPAARYRNEDAAGRPVCAEQIAVVDDVQRPASLDEVSTRYQRTEDGRRAASSIVPIVGCGRGGGVQDPVCNDVRLQFKLSGACDSNRFACGTQGPCGRKIVRIERD